VGSGPNVAFDDDRIGERVPATLLKTRQRRLVSISSELRLVRHARFVSAGAPAIAAVSIAALLIACSGSRGPEGVHEGAGAGSSPPPRVEAVASRREDPAARFCDLAYRPGEGRLLALPATEGPPPPTQGWRWINVWATWCAPCVEELPRIVAWRTRLAQDGVPVDTYFVSVDASPEDIARFRAAHADVPESARLVDPGGLPALISALGLDPGATIPIHAIVDPEHRIRCVRTGSVGERDYETVRAILRGR
jgi:thiol-disulfide isomerase/thioredoxin